MLNPERALPAEHADERAAAVWHDFPRCRVDRAVGRRLEPAAQSMRPLPRCASSPAPTTTAPGWALVAACMTRYEAWPISRLPRSALAVRRARPARVADRSTPCAPFAGSRCGRPWRSPRFWSTAGGRWARGSSSSGFFVAENPALGHPLDGVAAGLGRPPATDADRCLPWAACAAVGLDRRGRSVARAGGLPRSLVALALARRGRAAVVRVSARAIRSASATTCRWSSRAPPSPAPVSALLPRRARRRGGSLVVAAGRLAGASRSIATRRRDRRIAARRTRTAVGAKAVTAYLARPLGRQPIMMSMGSLGHYMHDLSRDGFRHRRLPARGQRRDLEIRSAHVRGPYRRVDR